MKAWKITGTKKKRGNSSESVTITSEIFDPVKPGEWQPGDSVPGEDQIEVPASEVLVYARKLALKNGFSPLHSPPDPVDSRRDPDLVFPGDRLILPDGRKTRIQKGGTIWEIAHRQYRKDAARLTLILQEVARLESLYRKDGNKKHLKRKEELMEYARRVAISPRLKEKLETNIPEKIKNSGT